MGKSQRVEDEKDLAKRISEIFLYLYHDAGALYRSFLDEPRSPVPQDRPGAKETLVELSGSTRRKRPRSELVLDEPHSPVPQGRPGAQETRIEASESARRKRPRSKLSDSGFEESHGKRRCVESNDSAPKGPPGSLTAADIIPLICPDSLNGKPCREKRTCPGRYVICLDFVFVSCSSSPFMCLLIYVLGQMLHCGIDA